MEGLFNTEQGAPMVILGQPDEEHQRIDNPLVVNMLSFLIYGTTTAEVKGLNDFPKDQWPTNIPLLYYSYHIMAGLGTIFIAVMALARFCCGAGKLYRIALDALDLDALPAVSLYCQHCRLDDRRNRTAALARLWPDAHQ